VHCAGGYNTGSFNTASHQTGSYISPNGTVVLYPVPVPVSPPLASVANPPTLSQLISTALAGSFQPITGSTSLGALIDGLKG